MTIGDAHGGDRQPGGQRQAGAEPGNEARGGRRARDDAEAERHERQAGLQRAVPEHSLRVERGELERCELRGGDAEDADVGDDQRPVAQDRAP
jgi:hypothetical protein